MNTIYFLSLLFDPGEATCFGETPRSIKIDNVTYATYLLEEKKAFNSCFFSINPMDFTKTRADASVTKYRNILIEMDKMVLDLQDQYISEIDMPYSTAVFSGKKSIHYIISLEESLPDEQTYRALVKRVYKAVGNNYVDQSCKNPSRFSRLPGHVRSDTGKEQKLLAIKSRVPLSTLNAWLDKRGATEDEWELVLKRPKFTFKDDSRLYPSTKNFLGGAVKENWNISLFKAAADLYRCGFNEEEILNKLLQVTGTLDANDRKTIYSAIKNEGARNEK